jgi:hypothetical protein
VGSGYPTKDYKRQEDNFGLIERNELRPYNFIFLLPASRLPPSPASGHKTLASVAAVHQYP